FEGQLGQNQDAQRATWYVNAFPERIRSQKNRRAGVAEASQQLVALSLTLDEQRPARTDVPLPPDCVGGATQRAVARKQREDPAVGCVRQLEQYACDCRPVPRLVIARFRDV